MKSASSPSLWIVVYVEGLCMLIAADPGHYAQQLAPVLPLPVPFADLRFCSSIAISIIARARRACSMRICCRFATSWEVREAKTSVTPDFDDGRDQFSKELTIFLESELTFARHGRRFPNSDASPDDQFTPSALVIDSILSNSFERGPVRGRIHRVRSEKLARCSLERFRGLALLWRHTS